MTDDLKQEIFDICSSNKPKYLYVEAYLEILQDEFSDSFYVDKVECAFTKLGDLSETELISSIKEMDLKGIQIEGCYHLMGLFNVEYDSDDYRSWSYLGDPEIIDLVLDMTFEQREKWYKEFEIGTPSSLTEDLFNLQ